MCDTLIALPDATADGAMLFAKNSDRPAGEGQRVQHYPARRHDTGAALSCTYIDIPQAPETHAVLLSKIDWMWGAEMGANDAGVVIGNEAVWSRAPSGPTALLGMDLVRLGLERAATAVDAVAIITDLLETHGQGGACAENDPGWTYDNGFLIADADEAWVLETAGRQWVAKRITTSTHNISNRISLGADHDRCSKGLESVDFSAVFSLAPPTVEPGSREAEAAIRLANDAGNISPDSLMVLLADHASGLCMHGPFETTSAMVSRLGRDGSAAHWFTDGPHPCQRSFNSFHGLFVGVT